MVVARRPVPVGRPMSFAVGLVRLGLAKTKALRPPVVLPGVPADVAVVESGEAALAPVVVTTRPATGLVDGLILATGVGVARATVHVGRRGVTPSRPTFAANGAVPAEVAFCD